MGRNAVLSFVITTLVAATPKVMEVRANAFAKDVKEELDAILCDYDQALVFTSTKPTEAETRAFIDGLCQGTRYYSPDGKLDVYGLDLYAKKGPFSVLWGKRSFHTALPGGGRENRESSLFSAPVKELDPTSVRADGKEVRMECALNRCFDIRGEGESPSYLSKVLVFQFCDHDTARRAARALRHLILLHGGKPSPF